MADRGHSGGTVPQASPPSWSLEAFRAADVVPMGSGLSAASLREGPTCTSVPNSGRKWWGLGAVLLKWNEQPGRV